jgi:hypothetical protein
VHTAGGTCYLHLPGAADELLQNSRGPTPLLVQLCDYLTLLDRDRRDDDLNIAIYDNDFKQSISLFQQCSQAMGYPVVPWTEKAISPTRLFELGEVVHTSPLDEDFVSFREVRQTLGWDNLRWLLASHLSSETVSIDMSGGTIAGISPEKSPGKPTEISECREIMQNAPSQAGELDASAFQSALQALNSAQRHHAEWFLAAISEYPAAVEQAGQSLEPVGLIQYYRKLCETVLSYYNNHQFKVSNHQQCETITIMTMAIAIRRLSEAIDKLTGSQIHLNRYAKQNSTL